MTSSPVVSTKEDSPTAIFLSRASMEMNSLEAILRNVKVAMGDLEAAEKRILGLRDLRRIEEANARLAKQEISSETHPADPEKVEVQNLFGVVAAADEGYQKVVTFLSRYL